MKIKCEHPVVLLNPSLRKLLSAGFNTLLTPLGLFHYADLHCPDYKKFYPRRCGVTPSSVDFYSIINDVTGETRPLYLVVPCGRCILCRSRKSNELACRCIAETNRWNTVPFFITFTYAPKFLPSDGVKKVDLQLFFKRLRSRLDSYKIEHYLRYFAVAEYGHKTGRAHYHVILWNFPTESFSNLSRVVSFLERCWSVYKLDNEGKRIKKKDSNGNIIRFKSGYPVYETEQIGMIKVLPMKDGCPAYVTKYMRKEPYIPAGMNPTFSLSSRGNGGIGRQFIESNRSYFKSSYNVTSLPITDKVISGKTFNMPITPYVKQILLPSASAKYSKKDYDLCKVFINRIELFNSLSIQFERLYKTYLFDYGKDEKRVYYEPFTDVESRPLWKQALQKCSFLGFSKKSDKDDIFSYLHTIDDFNEYAYVLIDEINNLAIRLLDIPDYSSYFCDRDQFLNERGYCLSVIYGNQVIDLPSLLEKARLKAHRNDWKDTF